MYKSIIVIIVHTYNNHNDSNVTDWKADGLTISPRLVPSPRGQRSNKRELLISACLAVIAQHGVAATTHRKIASEAKVPLGLTTYYFDNLQDLLFEAFSHFARVQSKAFASTFAAASSRADAQRAVVSIIREGQERGNSVSVLTHELYTLAARDSRFSMITQRWMADNQSVLFRFFDKDTVRMLDPLIEGLMIHGLLSTGSPDQTLVKRAVEKIVKE
jgi:DNA-binding transcriptional regulator YbjK